MSQEAIIHYGLAKDDFHLFLDGVEIKDIKSYEVIQEAGKNPIIRLEITILREIEARM